MPGIEPPFELLARAVEETPPVWAVAAALGFLPEVECKTLLLKTPNVLDIRLRKIELELIRNLFPEDQLS